MGEKIIAVDIDEVLSETLKCMLLKHGNLWRWRELYREDLTDYNIWNIEKLWLTQRQAILLFARCQFLSWILNKIDPVSWAKEKILELKSKWFKIIAVTARLIRVKLSTRLWLKRYFPNCFDEIAFAEFFTSRERKKSDICKEIWASIIFEDNLETCIDCANNWIKCYLFDKPWNQCDSLPDWITRVYSWDEIEL